MLPAICAILKFFNAVFTEWARSAKKRYDYRPVFIPLYLFREFPRKLSSHHLVTGETGCKICCLTITSRSFRTLPEVRFTSLFLFSHLSNNVGFSSR